MGGKGHKDHQLHPDHQRPAVHHGPAVEGKGGGRPGGACGEDCRELPVPPPEGDFAEEPSAGHPVP